MVGSVVKASLIRLKDRINYRYDMSPSGKTPDDKDSLIIDRSGPDMRTSVVLIIEIGMLSAPGALLV